MSYIESPQFRPVIERLVNLTLNPAFNSADYAVSAYPLAEVTDTLNIPAQVGVFGITDRNRHIRYEIYGHRLTGDNFIIVELNKWSDAGNTFLLNDEITTTKGGEILKDITEIVSKLTEQTINNPS